MLLNRFITSANGSIRKSHTPVSFLNGFITPLNPQRRASLHSFRSMAKHIFPSSTRMHLLSNLSISSSINRIKLGYRFASSGSLKQAQFNSEHQESRRFDAHTSLNYVGAVIIFFVGLSYAAVPLYKLVCTTTGLDGTPMTGINTQFSPDSMVPVRNSKPIKIHFDSSVADTMKWSFLPETKTITVVPGETALAFFKARNPTEEAIIGISTYSVSPAKAAQYFNKIQCFCFEEQRLEPGEEVDMPVFFFLDKEFAYDPYMEDVNSVTLHYTFFRSKHQ